MLQLLVGSVFADDSEHQVKLLDLQLKFLRATTPDFQHVAFVAKQSTGLFSKKTDVLPQQVLGEGESEHLMGLTAILQEFRNRQNRFPCFLVLDSDAFPIKSGWLSQLLNKMDSPVYDTAGNFVFNRHEPYEIAAALRYENMEQRLHASICFMKDVALDHDLDFRHGYVGDDLVGGREIDIYITPYQTERRDRAFPLIRSNKVNVHPLACGIYFDSFYHHGAGSRDLIVRGSNYWDRYAPTGQDYMADLMADPVKHISMLAGWNPERYASVT